MSLLRCHFAVLIYDSGSVYDSLFYVSSENCSDFDQEHSDKHSYDFQYQPTERTDLHPLDPVTAHHQDFYLPKTEDPNRNMSPAALLQEPGVNGGGENRRFTVR